MDKITRIQIARVPYEIGVSAQEDLKEYLDAIRDHLDSDLAEETITDIEVRITEILSDRNIKKDGVITVNDIKAIKAQLGSPEQFNDEEQDEKNLKNPATRKLLRSTDDGIIGGVASGLAAYFRIDAVFVRIVFIILTFLWGIGILLYLLLWLMVPAAVTASDKLQMRGEPVTASNLKRYRDVAGSTMETIKLRLLLRIVYKIARVVFTVLALGAILGVLILMGLASDALYTPPLRPIYVNYHPNYLLVGFVWLLIMVLIGLVIVLLLRLWHKHNSLLKPACFTLLGLLILSIAGAGITSPFVANHYKNLYGGNRLALNLPIQGSAATVSKLSISGDYNLNVSYEVTNQPVHATYQSYPGMGRPNINISDSKGTLTASAHNLNSVVPNCLLGWCKNIYLPVKVTIYGPVLTDISVNQQTEFNISNLSQTSLNIYSQDLSTVNLNSSYVQTLDLSAQTGSSIFTNNTTSLTSNIDADSNSYIYGPTSTSLNAAIPESCWQPVLEIQQNPTYATINSQEVSQSELNQNNCIVIDNFVPTPPASPTKNM
jgi:phage shock protein PspC (stress-responsive transcriptional regulator)